MKALDPLHDGNENGFPDELEDLYSNLLISEVCYVSLTAVAAHQPHTFLPAGEDSVLQPAFLNRPTDWVEILNPTDHDISTAGYFFSDKAGDPTRFPLPASVIIPAYGTLILLLTDDPHPLFSTEGDPNSMVRKCWVPFRLKDEGETVYLNQLDAENIPTRVDTFSPPWTATYALTGYTAGRVPRADGTWQSVFLPAASPSQVNQGWGLTRALSVPLISEQPAGGGTSAPARSRLFRDPSTLPRITLSHPDPEAVITYTLDGSEPGPEDGIYEGPLEIHTTTVLRARAYAAGAIPSPVVTRTYISSEGVLTQSIPPVWPLIDNTSRTAIDPAVSTAYGHTVPPARAGYTSTRTILDQLEARPAVFLTIDPAGAIIEGGPGGDPETRIAFEWVDPARPEDYRQENAFLQETGQFSTGRNAKKSYDILFKGSATLTGKSSWDGPVLGNGKSAVFPGMSASGDFPGVPGSPVTKFPRLLLRNSSQGSFSFSGPGFRIYIADAWLKETQRALHGNAPGFVTGHRRWVHVFINGYYWGVYDLEEHLNADTVSAHLLAEIPNPTPEQKELFKPSNILFGKPLAPPDFSTSAVEDEWWAETVPAAAIAVRQASVANRPDAFNTLVAQLDLDRYIDYICTLQTTEATDVDEVNIRVWRHPFDLKWRCIAWDGDTMNWSSNSTQPQYVNDEIFSDFRIGSGQLSVHRSIKFLPEYSTVFGSRLQTHLAGPLSQESMTSRFHALVSDFRLTLECEALRWGRLIPSGTDALATWENTLVSVRDTVVKPYEPVEKYL